MSVFVVVLKDHHHHQRYPPSPTPEIISFPKTRVKSVAVVNKVLPVAPVRAPSSSEGDEFLGAPKKFISETIF